MRLGLAGFGVLAAVVGCSLAAGAGALDVKTLPAAERAMADEVDHWGLPFSDCLRRFAAGEAHFRQALGDAAPRDFVVGVQHALEKVPRNKYWFKGDYTNAVRIESARNEHESFQVAVLPGVGKCLKEVTLKPGELRAVDGKGVIPADAMTVYRVGYVDTAPAGYPVLYQGAWPDPLLPNGPLEIKGTDLGLFWVEIKTPADAAPGEYEGSLELRADGVAVPVKVKLLAHKFALPDAAPLTVAVWTAGGDAKLYGTLLEHWFTPLSIGKTANLAELDKNLEFGFAHGLRTFEVAADAKNPEGLRPLVEHLRQKGWLDKAIVYSNADEPDSETLNTRNIPFHQRMHALYPELPVFLASEWHEGIDQACDIWMTDLSTAKGVDFAKANKGKAKLWFYFCHLPIHIDYHRPLVQAPNMLLDNEAVEHRVAVWALWKYGAEGMFIFGGNLGWTGKDAANWKLDAKPYGFPYAGVHNGNGYLVYPGPTPSVRMKVLRDGVEDYAYLKALEKAAAACSDPELRRRAGELLAVPAGVLVDAHYFNRDPAVLLAARHGIAALLDAMAR